MSLCGRCNLKVFPVEQLNCLDKTWHKGCFKCTECGMTLNMKTYKGFNKSPYCEAHIPKAKATTVAETPELKRIQENTKIQSNAVYHAEFEKAKGKFTQVADDPELLRIKQNSKIISNVAYHGDLEKKAMMEQKRNLSGEGGDAKNGFIPPAFLDELPTPQPPQPKQQPQQQQQHQPHHHQQQQQHIQAQQHHQAQQQQQHQAQQQQQRSTMSNVMQQQNSYSTSPYSARGAPNVIYSSDVGPVNANSSSRKVGSIADYDPVNNYYGSLDPQRSSQQHSRIPNQHQHQQHLQQQQQILQKQRQQQHQQQLQYQQQQQQQHLYHQQRSQQQQQQQQQARQPQQQQHHGISYKALYDYEAQDSDEISFIDGDMIIDCTAVDEGWMTGTVQRTGQRGMLPANYVSPA